jgi:hypothetical protein
MRRSVRLARKAPRRDHEIFGSGGGNGRAETKIIICKVLRSSRVRSIAAQISQGRNGREVRRPTLRTGLRRRWRLIDMHSMHKHARMYVTHRDTLLSLDTSVDCISISKACHVL